MRALSLAFAHLRFHGRRTAVLIGCLWVSALVPLVLQQVMPKIQAQLYRRASETPVVFGGPGSSLELVLHALYFRDFQAPPLRYGDWQALHLKLQEQGSERLLPLHIRFQTQGFPIVGTHLEYFEYRTRDFRDGEAFSRLGDCVVGSQVAEQLQLQVGDALISSPQSIFSPAADYPLQMTIVGILQPSNSPDDQAVFVDIKTTWVIENLGHGHEDVTQLNDPNRVLERTREGTVASAAVMPYTVITEENLASFHFHGDPAEFPVTAMILLESEQSHQDLAAGFALSRPHVQTVLADSAIDDLLGILFQIQTLILAVSLFVALATMALFGLVMGLSVQIRRQEMETLYKLGASRGLTMAMLAIEILLIGCCSAALAWGSSFIVVRSLEQDLLQWFR
jgi:putative ABC transport system permease protein